MFGLRRVDRAQILKSEDHIDSFVTRLLRAPKKLIATLLLGNEFINVAISAVMAGAVGSVFISAGELEQAGIATALALPVLLFLGEITPKTVAMKSPLPWARRAARPLWFFYVLVSPLRWVVQAIAKLILIPLGGANIAEPLQLSERELLALVDAGSAEGEVDARERRLIHKVFEFGDKTVAVAMQPGDDLFALSYELPIARLVREVASRGYSRVPIYHQRRDNIVGILHAKDLVIQSTGLHAPRRLTDMLKEPLFVPPTTPVELMFRIFKQRKTHMALVVNEYGKLVGLVTMEDLLEELFGEIRDEREPKKAQKTAPPPGDSAGDLMPMTESGVADLHAMLNRPTTDRPLDPPASDPLDLVAKDEPEEPS